MLHRQSDRCWEPFARDPRIGVGHFVDAMLMALLPILPSGAYFASPPLLAVALLVLDGALASRQRRTEVDVEQRYGSDLHLWRGRLRPCELVRMWRDRHDPAYRYSLSPSR